MHEAILSGTWKKVIVIMFISSTVLLTVSYYDYSKLLNYQVLLTTTVGGVNVSDNNHTEGKLRILSLYVVILLYNNSKN